MAKVNRAQWVIDIMMLADFHKIQPHTVLGVIAMSHDMEWTFKPLELQSLLTKGILKTDRQTIDVKKFYKPFKESEVDEEDISESLVLTKPTKISENSEKVANNLFEKFVPDNEREPKYIESIAKKYFLGEYYVAKYYITFKHLFPKGDLDLDFRWNKEFKMTYHGMTKWEEKATLRTKFKTICKTKDIGIFLLGTFYAVQNSISKQSGECFMTKVSRYLLDYEKWMEYARKKLVKKETYVEIKEQSL